MAAGRRLIQAVGGVDGRSLLREPGGKESLVRRLPGLAKGTVHGRSLLVLIDLDDSAPCAKAFLGELPEPGQPNCIVRVAVHALESWLMADRDAYARYAGVAVRLIPTAPDGQPRPKGFIQSLADDGTAKRLAFVLREARSRGVPDWRTLGRWHTQFVETIWQPDRARHRSQSLDRCLTRLAQFAATVG